MARGVPTKRARGLTLASCLMCVHTKKSAVIKKAVDHLICKFDAPIQVKEYLKTHIMICGKSNTTLSEACRMDRKMVPDLDVQQVVDASWENFEFCSCKCSRTAMTLALVIAPARWAKHFACSASTVHKLPRIPSGLTTVRSSHSVLPRQSAIHVLSLSCAVCLVLFPPCAFCGPIGIAHSLLSLFHSLFSISKLVSAAGFFELQVVPQAEIHSL